MVGLYQYNSYSEKKKEEEENYAQMADNEKGILNLITDSKEAVIILGM